MRVIRKHCSTSTCFLVLVLLFAVAVAQDDDAYLWLEDIESANALEWAANRSAVDTALLEAVPEYEGIHDELLEVYNSTDRIPEPSIRGAWIYNFWRDATHVRGVWRRTFLDEYLKEDPSWEIVLDLDALAEREEENWVWGGATCLPPEHRLCMVSLSRGGADAAEVREFDTTATAFVEDGFFVPEAKANVSWRDEDTLWLGTDFGEGSLTTSGYPRIATEWTRGIPIEEANRLYEGSVEDVSVSAFSAHTPEGRFDLVSRSPGFFTRHTWLILDGRRVKLDVPDDAEIRDIFQNQLLVALKTDWEIAGTTYLQGALLAIDVDRFLAGERDFDVLFEPEERVSLGDAVSTLDSLILTTLDNVRGRLYRLRLEESEWTREEIELPGLGTVGIDSAGEVDDSFFFSYTDFTTPASLYLVRDGAAPVRAKSSPSWFDTEGINVAQHEAISKDGTRIPYFVVTPKRFAANGTTPTLLTAYGGFELSRVPQYSGTVGRAWLARGGAYVLANIRGGGEFGPEWHHAAMRENHQNNFDDMIAVSEDLIARGITSPHHLGIMGGSQGGLLVAGTFIQRPDLFNAVVSAIPLIDMKRYNKLLAGASWMAEYGNPDTDDWDAFMKQWSPYQNVDPDADYPEVFFWTNTRDDRVHPGHARKMAAKMTDMGHRVFYYENTEGGHGGGADLNQRAYTDALTNAYLWMKLR